jgi:hypothetical protein
VFDVNRNDVLSSLVAPGPRRTLEALTSTRSLPFRLAVVGNRSDRTLEVVEWIREAGTRESTQRPTGLAWPSNVFSMGHLAVPMPPDDPMYGLAPRVAHDGLAIPLGRGAPLGEAGALAIGLGHFARLRSNPFFTVIVDRVDAAVRADAK